MLEVAVIHPIAKHFSRTNQCRWNPRRVSHVPMSWFKFWTYIYNSQTPSTMDEAKDRFVVCKILRIPSSVSSVAFGHAGHLFVGSGIEINLSKSVSCWLPSDDGSLRVYDLSTFKTIKAVRGLGAEVSSIICVKRAGSELRDAWLAHGSKVCLNSLSHHLPR